MSDFGSVSSGAGYFDSFKNNQTINGTKEFLESNSLVAKFAFLLLVLIVFIIAVRLGGMLLAWIFSFNGSPYIFNGMIDAKQMMVIPQDPNLNNSIPILRSDNQNDGIEFTYSVWLFVDNMTYKEGEFKHVFHKGNADINTKNKPIGMNFPNNAPGLYLSPDTNGLVVVMNTFNDIEEKLTIENLPMNMWVCVQIVVENNQLDVYINGKLAKRLIMKGVPKQNYGDLYVAMNGGFSGYMSNLRYYDYSLGTAAIQDIVNDGPNLKMTGTNINSVPRYLSLRWFFMGNKDGYNP
tara:strand:- start:466 stop:1344 length:879 start_codon:yes stop_codon:yes gene_type:complete